MWHRQIQASVWSQEPNKEDMSSWLLTFLLKTFHDYGGRPRWRPCRTFCCYFRTRFCYIFILILFFLRLIFILFTLLRLLLVLNILLKLLYLIVILLLQESTRVQECWLCSTIASSTRGNRRVGATTPVWDTSTSSAAFVSLWTLSPRRLSGISTFLSYFFLSYFSSNSSCSFSSSSFTSSYTSPGLSANITMTQTSWRL